MINIGENIKTSRKALGLTQEELAVQIGVTPQAVSRWESGSGLPDVTLIVSLAGALSVTTDMLLGMDSRDTDESELASIKENLDKLDKENQTPWDAAGAKVKYMLELVESKPMDHENALRTRLDLRTRQRLCISKRAHKQASQHQGQQT